MSSLNIPATDSTPSVTHDPATGVLRLEGESYPEDVVAFYAPIVDWLRGHLAASPGTLNVQFALRYLNTSSTKALLDLLSVLDEHHRDGGHVVVEWHYDPAIEVMREAGEEFGEDVSLPYHLIPRS